MQKDNEFIARRIRTQYIAKESTALDELKALDQRVKRPAGIFAYAFGTVGALVLGTGMSLAMEVIGKSMLLGIGVGLIGILMVAVNYPLYQSILDKRRKKYADRIVEISDKIIKEESK